MTINFHNKIVINMEQELLLNDLINNTLDKIKLKLTRMD